MEPWSFVNILGIKRYLFTEWLIDRFPTNMGYLDKRGLFVECTFMFEDICNEHSAGLKQIVISTTALKASSSASTFLHYSIMQKIWLLHDIYNLLE